MLRSLVGSEMCIRDRGVEKRIQTLANTSSKVCAAVEHEVGNCEAVAAHVFPALHQHIQPGKTVLGNCF
mgnify:CR=1 FL=1